MTERIDRDWFQLVYAHYNYIHIFDKNDKYENSRHLVIILQIF